MATKATVHFILRGTTACGAVGPTVEAATHVMARTTCVVCRVTRPFIDAERRAYDRQNRRRHLEHLLLCHPDEAPCPDGCDGPPLLAAIPRPSTKHGRWAIADCVSCACAFAFESIPDVENGPSASDLDDAPDLCAICRQEA